MSGFKRWTLRLVASLFGLTLLTLAAGFIYEQVGRTLDVKRLPKRIGQAIDVGGRTMNLYCSGNGTPTVIFEEGGNEPGYSSALVQTKVARFTRACWYDRAGVGWSDPPSSPRTSTSVARDLNETLRRAGVLPPYVMVGSSVGGEYVRIYAARYPNDVAGLILVDSTVPDQREPGFMLGPANRLPVWARHLLCVALPAVNRFGVLRFVARGNRRPLSSDFTSEQRETLAKLEAQPKAYEADAKQACAATDEGRVVPSTGGGNPDLDNAARNAGSLGDRPLIVLTAGQYWAPPGFEREAKEYHDLWMHQLQAGLAQLSTRGRQVIVDAHHDMAEAPDAVIAAAQRVVNEIRARKTTDRT